MKRKIISDIKELHKRLGRRPVKRDNSSLNCKARKYFGSWNNALEEAGYNVDYKQSIDTHRITPDLCYFVGLVATDGHIQIFKNRKTKSCKYCVYLFTSYPEELKLIISLIKRLFNYIPLVRKRKYGWNKLTNYEIQINSKFLVEFINKTFGIPIGSKSFSIEVPRVFFLTNKHNVSAFIRGLIDGDGSVNYGGISICSASQKFMHGLIKLFKFNFDIDINSLSKNGNVMSIRIGKKDDIKRLYLFLYPAKYGYPRKKASWDKLLKIRST